MPPVHENLADVNPTTSDIPTMFNTSTQNIAPSYGTINQTPSSQGYSSGGELHQFPEGSSSDSSQPSSSNASSRQAMTNVSSSQPLLGRPGQPKVMRRNRHQNQNESDSTV